jgi:hypothetical protein
MFKKLALVLKLSNKKEIQRMFFLVSEKKNCVFMSFIIQNFIAVKLIKRNNNNTRTKHECSIINEVERKITVIAQSTSI